jgi:hypothetical protein
MTSQVIKQNVVFPAPDSEREAFFPLTHIITQETCQQERCYVICAFDKLNAVYSRQALGRGESPSPPDSETSFLWMSENGTKREEF